MINAQMRSYDFYTIGGADEYGQQKISAEKQGTIKMAISVTSQSVQDNILYAGCAYMGLTHDRRVNDTFLIDYNGKKLKVLYVGRCGRLWQVFMQGVE